MTRVGIQTQPRVRQLLEQSIRVDRRHHHIALAVHDQYWLRNVLKPNGGFCGGGSAPADDRLELRRDGLLRAVRIPLARTPLLTGDERAAGALAAVCPIEEEK